MAEKATVKLDFDIGSLRKGLQTAGAGIKNLVSKKPKVAVDVDTKEIDAAGKKIDKLSSTETVKINVDTKGLDKATSDTKGKLSGLAAGFGGALGGIGAQAVTGIIGGLKEGAIAADDFGDSLEVAFKAQGIADVDAEIEKVSKSSLDLANNLGLPVARTKELAVSVSTLGGFTGQSAQDLTKLAAGLETFTNGAVKGEQVAKAFARGVNDPEGAAAIEALSKKYPQLAEVLRSNIDPAEKLRLANEQLGESFKTVEEQQSDVGGTLNKLQNQLADVFEKVGAQLLDALLPLAESLLPILESLIPVVQGILEPLAPILGELGKAVGQVVSALSGPLLNLAKAVIEPLMGLIMQLLPVVMQLISIGMKPLTEIINILADLFRELFPALQPVFDVIIGLLPVIANLAGTLLQSLVPVIRVAAKLLLTLVKAITENKVVMAALQLVLNLVVGALNMLVGVFGAVATAAEFVLGIIEKVISYITNLINAIASFDLNAIKNALLGIDKPANKAAAATAKVGNAAQDAAEAAKLLNEENAKLKPPPAPPDPEAAKKYAEALKKAKEELEGLTTAQAKQRELLAADDLATEEERAKKRIEIEQKYAVAALEQERKALTSKGKLRTTEEAVINKKIEIIREENARKIQEIEAKSRQEAVKQAEENEKKLTDIATKFATERVARLKEALTAGNTAVANELLSAQRALIESNVSNAIDAIVAQTPQYTKAIAELNAKLAAGLSPAEYEKEASAIRQRIFQELQALPASTTDVFARQIRAAYQGAGDEIAKGTAEVVALIKQQQVKQAGEIFADSLRGIGEALRSVDFASIYGNAAEQAASLNEEQEKLIDNLKNGETSYQDSVSALQDLGAKQAETASATQTAIAASFQAIADQQAKAAEDGITAANEALQRKADLAKQEIELEKQKAAELKALQDQGIADKETFEAAKKAIEDKYALETDKVQKEQTKASDEAAESQSAALNNIAVSAGAAFASLVAGGENAGEALKKVVGQTVSALLDLYTPSIVALFSSIIPPPFGAIAGFAAVQGLKALLQSALNGFEEGGYTGNAGTKQVAGVVHGQEFVMTADVTKRNRALLEHLHAGKSVESFPALQKMLADNSISTIPVTELQLMRSELSAIRQRLDSMPNGIQGSMGVDVNVGMDTYLYERDRARMNARNLRG